ncbi:hypothetical protein [Baekduia sp.]|uniref:hypothetical protein n=1 Tax=Baekduia sp. TaxID=2600305 RepID=UPI002E09811F|nr:hypothetical protein [Baekduia sp.]
MVLIDQLSPDAPLDVRHAGGVDERGARRTLRAQIARLERELGETIAAAFPHVHDADTVAFNERAPFRIAGPLSSGTGPRLLGLGELERVRDDLAERIRRARVVVADRAELEADSRALLEEMLREPARYKRVRLPVADLGEPGCGAYQVRPRLGIIGMLMGWWHIKLSSGCPKPAPA